MLSPKATAAAAGAVILRIRVRRTVPAQGGVVVRAVATVRAAVIVPAVDRRGVRVGLPGTRVLTLAVRATARDRGLTIRIERDIVLPKATLLALPRGQ